MDYLIATNCPISIKQYPNWPHNSTILTWQWIAIFTFLARWINTEVESPVNGLHTTWLSRHQLVLRYWLDRTKSHFWNKLLLESRNASIMSISIVQSSGCILTRNHYERKYQTYTWRKQCCASSTIYKGSSISRS
jgi:hypothetical protein